MKVVQFINVEVFQKNILANYLLVIKDLILIENCLTDLIEFLSE